ncbi:MAG: intermembrane transport protein PqiB [Alphaproteobacteria bacterium]
MTEYAEQQRFPQARAHRARRVSVIWAIPLVALLIGAWLAWDTLSKEGPTIEISFQSGEGLQAGQSQLKYKDIVFGTVKNLRLSADLTRVIVTVATTAQARPMLTDGTVFWVVKPRLFAGNISGLETVFSGSYIGMLPAATAGKAQREFAGQEDPPILTAHVPGRTFLLKSKKIGSVSVGAPIFYRDLSVGEVLGWDIGDMAEDVTIHAFIRAPYDAYVSDQTRFWNASGILFKLSGTGLDVQMESLRALLLGGIAFETPVAEAKQAAIAEANHVFPLFADREQADAASYTRKIQVISYFPGSVQGLGPGSDVTMHGLKIGEVTNVRLAYDAAKEAIVAPVRYEVEPERIVGIGNRVVKTDSEAVTKLLARGLRASLQSASLITGQQTVALDFVENASVADLKMEGQDFVLPTTEGGGFASLASSATDLLNKVKAMPFAEIGRSLDSILSSANDVTSSPETKKSLSQLAATIASTQDLMKRLDGGVGPVAKQLPEMSTELQRTLKSTNKLLLSLDTGYGGDTRFNRDFTRVLAEAVDALRSIRSLANLLERHPEALIKGRAGAPVQ